MASKKVTVDTLGNAIKEILKDYDDEVSKNLTDITKEITKAGVQALKSESKEKFGTTKTRKRKYANTWTSQFETSRVSSQGTIYNTQPGLPHLLENGHAKVNGGRVPGRAHISTVEEKLIKEFEREVKSKL